MWRGLNGLSWFTLSLCAATDRVQSGNITNRHGSSVYCGRSTAGFMFWWSLTWLLLIGDSMELRYYNICQRNYWNTNKKRYFSSHLVLHYPSLGLSYENSSMEWNDFIFSIFQQGYVGWVFCFCFQFNKIRICECHKTYDVDCLTATPGALSLCKNRVWCELSLWWMSLTEGKICAAFGRFKGGFQMPTEKRKAAAVSWGKCKKKKEILSKHTLSSVPYSHKHDSNCILVQTDNIWSDKGQVHTTHTHTHVHTRPRGQGEPPPNSDPAGLHLHFKHADDHQGRRFFTITPASILLTRGVVSETVCCGRKRRQGSAGEEQIRGLGAGAIHAFISSVKSLIHAWKGMQKESKVPWLFCQWKELLLFSWQRG